MKKALILFLLLLASLFAFSSCSSTEKGVCINEVMSSNISTYKDENGKFSDWVELYNSSSSPVNLKGYMLSDNRYDIDIFTFPEIILQPGEYFVVFADKTNVTDTEKRIVHVPFGLSSQGESPYLFNAEGKMQSFLSFGAIDAGKSAGLNERGSLTVFDIPTPGSANTEAVPESYAPLKTGLYINEYTTKDTQCITDEDGDFSAFAEIYNSTDKDISLYNMSLSDDITDLAKWTFPDVTVKAKGYLLVFLSGKEKVYDGINELHAAFELKGKEERLYLCDERLSIVDSIEVYELMSNLTCGRSRDNLTEILFFPKATPGSENTQKGFTSVDSARYTGNKALTVTELAAVNTTAAYSDGEYYDYIEIKNNTDKEINLKDYKLSDSKKAESFIPLPHKKLKAGEYAVIYCADKTEVRGSDIFVSLGLNRYGETVYISDSIGIIVDSFSYGRLSSSYCAGRDEKGTEETVYYKDFTPKGKNPEKKLKSALSNPVFSKGSSYALKGEKIELTAKKGEIRYTTDGSVPTEKSRLYKNPIEIKKNTVIRARAFLEGFVPSDTVNATFLTERQHGIDVVFLTTDEDNLYDYNTGIWADGPGISEQYPYVGANYWQDWEREVNFELMTKEGQSEISFDAGIKVFGQYSRAQTQKSVSINLRDKYGPTEICYPFFEDNDVNVFSSLVLRNGGQDFQKSHIRDAFCAMVIKNSIDVDFMDYKPVATYVNGKYHGIYDLREKIDEDYLANHRGLDSKNVDLIKGSSTVQNGSVDNYKAILDYVKTHDLRNEKNYAYVCSQVDIDELIRYWMCESFFTNTDTGNIRFYRENKEGAKWRWIFFDVDWCLYPTTYKKNYIENYLNPKGHGYKNMFSTAIMVNLMKNQSFRKRVLEIHSKHLKTTFDTERMLKIYDGLISEIDEEMKYHCKKWGVISYEGWKKSTMELRNIISEKKEIFISHMKESFNMTKEECELYL